MRQVPLFRLVAGKLVRVPCRLQFEAREIFPHELSKPDIAEVHQLAVLDLAVIRRIGEDPIEACRLQFRRRRDAQRISTFAHARPVSVVLPDPLSPDREQSLCFCPEADLEGRVAIALRLGVFLDNVDPAARTHTERVAVRDTEQIGLDLDIPDGKAMD